MGVRITTWGLKAENVLHILLVFKMHYFLMMKQSLHQSIYVSVMNYFDLSNEQVIS